MLGLAGFKISVSGSCYDFADVFTSTRFQADEVTF